MVSSKNSCTFTSSKHMTQSKIKLTEAQKEVVRKMRDGAYIWRSNLMPIYYIHYAGGNNKCTLQAIALYSAKLIEKDSKDDYHLTALGRTIEI